MFTEHCSGRNCLPDQVPVQRGRPNQPGVPTRVARHRLSVRRVQREGGVDRQPPTLCWLQRVVNYFYLSLYTKSSRLLLLLPLITIYQLTGGRRFQDWKLHTWGEVLATLVKTEHRVAGTWNWPAGNVMIDHQSQLNHLSCFPNIAIPLCFNNDWKLNSFSSNDIFIRRSDTPHVLVAPQYLFSPHDGLATLLWKIVEDYHSDAFTSYII